jgi:peptide chain release factor subunit 1
LSRDRTSVLTRRQVQDLSRLRLAPYLVTTLYLDVARSAAGGRQGTLRKLVRDAKTRLGGRELTRKQRQSAEEDLATLDRLVRDARARGARSICAILASGSDYEEVVDLPHPVKDRLVQEETPYVRPLAAMLNDYPRYLVVLIDRSRARFLAAHLGRIQELQLLSSDVPGQVRTGVHRGRGNMERQIERHIDDHVARHVKATADAARQLFGERDYDLLIVGGPGEPVTDLREALNPSLRPYLAGEVAVDLAAAPEDALAACRVLIGEVNAKRDADLVERLVDGVESSDLAVSGTAATLGALRRGAVATLVMVEDYEEEGAECRSCGFLSLEEGTCPACGREGGLRKAAYLSAEMMDRAANAGAEIRHVTTEPAARRLRAMGGVGALLRFRLV